jgi:hypothetical protein
MEVLVNRSAVQPRWRAVLRLGLGRAQMIGSIVTLVLLIQYGVGPVVILGTIVTGLVTLTSFVLFHVLWRERR